MAFRFNIPGLRYSSYGDGNLRINLDRLLNFGGGGSTGNRPYYSGSQQQEQRDEDPMPVLDKPDWFSSLVGGFRSIFTKETWKQGSENGWQGPSRRAEEIGRYDAELAAWHGRHPDYKGPGAIPTAMPVRKPFLEMLESTEVDANQDKELGLTEMKKLAQSMSKGTDTKKIIESKITQVEAAIKDKTPGADLSINLAEVRTESDKIKGLLESQKGLLDNIKVADLDNNGQVNIGEMQGLLDQLKINGVKLDTPEQQLAALYAVHQVQQKLDGRAA